MLATTKKLEQDIKQLEDRLAIVKATLDRERRAWQQSSQLGPSGTKWKGAAQLQDNKNERMYGVGTNESNVHSSSFCKSFKTSNTCDVHPLLHLSTESSIVQKPNLARSKSISFQNIATTLCWNCKSFILKIIRLCHRLYESVSCLEISVHKLVENKASLLNFI
ncbi:hypothetical protein Plhal304r1_c051g0134331 [Plasmopara halstedii]